jgi:hypothetical protein
VEQAIALPSPVVKSKRQSKLRKPSGTDRPGNGAEDPAQVAPALSRTAQIRATIAEHPEWGYQKVAEHLGQRTSVVRTIFERCSKGSAP